VAVVPGRPVVYVCRGVSCRKDARRHGALVEELCAVADVELVRCQSICKGPVAGVEVDGRLEWFRRVRRTGRRALAAWLLDGGRRRLPDALRERRVRKRRGRLRT
jgi:hypothetical protein